MATLALAILPRAVLAVEPVQNTLLDGVAAFVNQRMITIGEVSGIVAPMAMQLHDQYRGPELETRLRDAYHRALSNLIERALILEAYERNEMRIPDQAMESRLREIKFEHFGNDRLAMQRELREAGLTLESWRDQLRESMIVSFMREMHVTSRIVISPADIRRDYAESLERYRTPNQVRLRVIVIRDHDPNQTARSDLAESLVARLREGARFEDLAREFSDGRRADDGGDWGWMNVHELRPELAEPSMELSVQKISDVITMNSDHYIIQVLGRRRERIKPLAEVLEDLRQELWQRESDRLYANWIARLEVETAVYRMEDVF